jgi:hypothetical protein
MLTARAHRSIASQLRSNRVSPPKMFEQAFKNIDDVLWREAGCNYWLDYTGQASWLLTFASLRKLLAESCSVDTLLDCPGGTFQGAAVLETVRGVL